MIIIVGIVLFLFPETWSDDYGTGFATGAFLVFMLFSPNIIYCVKWILRKTRPRGNNHQPDGGK